MSADPAIPADLVGQPPDLADEIDEAIIAAALDGAEGPVTYGEGVTGPGSLEDRAPAVYAWYPQTPDEAEWAMRKLAVLQEREADVKARHAIWAERIARNLAGEVARVRPGIDYFTGRIKTYALARRQLAGEKTTRLPSGTVATRGSDTPRATVADEAAVVAWAQATLNAAEYEKVVKTEESVLVTGLRALTEVREKQPLLPAAEWQPILGIWIEYPDGWATDDDADWETPIDKADFQLRASVSAHHVEEPTEPEPLAEWIVVVKSTGEVMPGVIAEHGTVTATVTVEK